MKKFLMVLLSIAFVLNLAIVIGLIGGYGSPRRALYTITDELMNSAYPVSYTHLTLPTKA